MIWDEARIGDRDEYLGNSFQLAKYHDFDREPFRVTNRIHLIPGYSTASKPDMKHTEIRHRAIPENLHTRTRLGSGPRTSRPF